MNMDNLSKSPTNPNSNSVDGFARPSAPSTPAMSSPTTTPNPAANNNSPVTQAPPTAPTSKSTVSGSMNKKSKMWTTILVILIVVIFAGGIYGVYMYQQKKINTANASIATLTVANTSLKSQLAKAKTTTTTSVSINGQSTATGSSTTLTVFKVPELGISLALPANLADITYVATSTKTTVNLSSQNLAAADPACTASATVAPLGSLTKVTGQFPTTPSTTTSLVKQYPTYYIAYIKAAADCSKVAQVNTLASSLVTSLKASFPSVQVITT